MIWHKITGKDGDLPDDDREVFVIDYLKDIAIARMRGFDHDGEPIWEPERVIVYTHWADIVLPEDTEEE